jgi:peptide/nickel transport system substrate-binding protein
MGGRKLHVLLGALALGGLFQVVGVEKAAHGSTARPEQEGGIFRIALNAISGIDYLDPALASSPPGWALLDTTCARLLAYPDKAPPAGFRLQPEVAAGFPAISSDRTTYTFKLRSGFRFSDGTPVRASAFARAITRMLAPEMHSPGVQYVRDIIGAGRVLTGKADVPEGVVARGDTLVIRLTRPAPDFPHRTASTFFCAVPPSLPIDPEGRGAFPCRPVLRADTGVVRGFICKDPTRASGRIM